MLVLTRRLGQSVTLERGDTTITVTVTEATEASTGRVRLGIDAGRDWHIIRNEITKSDNRPLKRKEDLQ